MLRHNLLAVLSLVAVSCGPGDPLGSDTVGAPVSVGSVKQLFIDERLIDHSTGVTLTVNPARKTGEASIQRDQPWEKGGVKWASVVQDGNVLRMWYEAHLEPGERWKTQLLYATSTDGRHWEKPDLGLFSYQDSTSTNIVFHGTGEWISGSCVFLDTAAPPAERYKMVFGDRFGDPDQSTAGAYSSDGLHWIPYDLRRLIDQGTDTQNAGFFDSRLGQYALYTRLNASPFNGTGSRRVGRSESAAFSNFPRASTVMQSDELDPPQTGIYNSAAIHYPFAGDDVYFAFPSLLNENAPSSPMNIQLAVSRNGLTWLRPSRTPFVETGPAGSFDSGMIFMAVGLVRSGDELWMYYTGYPVTHAQVSPQRSNDAMLSRVRIRLDGFMSADAGPAGGEMVTVPLRFSGDRLRLNVDPGNDGDLSVAVLDAAGMPIPGFTHDDMDTITSDGVAQEVTWRGRSDLSALAGQVVRLDFRLRAAKLYAFQFGGV